MPRKPTPPTTSYVPEDVEAYHKAMDERQRIREAAWGPDEWLLDAAYKGDVDKARDLVENQGANVNFRFFFKSGRQEHTPFIAAACDGRLEMLKFLHSKGAEVNAEDGYHNTALYHAVTRFDPDMVEFLLSVGADRHQRCCWGTSAEYIWQEFRNPEGEPDEHPNNNACRRLIGPLEDNTVHLRSPWSLPIPADHPILDPTHKSHDKWLAQLVDDGEWVPLVRETPIDHDEGFYMGPKGHRKEYGIPDRDIAPEEPPKIHSALEWKYRRMPGWKDPRDYHKKFIYPM